MNAEFGHLPTAGESFAYEDRHFQVVDMDGRRIDKLRVSRPAPSTPAA